MQADPLLSKSNNTGLNSYGDLIYDFYWNIFPQEWLEDICEKNKWDHRTSPIIWRELLDRGGKGLLLGGYNEFLEHAQVWDCVASLLTRASLDITLYFKCLTS